MKRKGRRKKERNEERKGEGVHVRHKGLAPFPFFSLSLPSFKLGISSPSH
jgi:hypothetical protein